MDAKLLQEAAGPCTWSSRTRTCDASSTPLVVNAAATICQMLASTAMCRQRHDRRVFLPCFLSNHRVHLIVPKSDSPAALSSAA